MSKILYFSPIIRVRNIHTLKDNNIEARCGLKFIYFIPITNYVFHATAVQHLPMCVSHYGLGWLHYVRPVIGGCEMDYKMNIITSPVAFDTG